VDLESILTYLISEDATVRPRSVNSDGSDELTESDYRRG
jgi:hypothetical protein